MILRMKKAQSTLEYAVLIIIVIGGFLAMQQYVKRGFQGRMKQSVDDFGEQYDPAAVNSSINYTTTAESSSVIKTIPAIGPSGEMGYYTNREDRAHSIETKNGYTDVGTKNP